MKTYLIKALYVFSGVMAGCALRGYLKGREAKVNSATSVP